MKNFLRVGYWTQEVIHIKFFKDVVYDCRMHFAIIVEGLLWRKLRILELQKCTGISFSLPKNAKNVDPVVLKQLAINFLLCQRQPHFWIVENKEELILNYVAAQDQPDSKMLHDL